jgi:hypothetical protein
MVITRRQALRWLAAGGSWAALPSCGSAAEWPTQWQAGSLRFHADFPLVADAAVVRDALELRQSVPATLGLPPSDETIYLYLFSRQPTYRGYVQQYFPGVPYRRALFIKQQEHGMVFAYVSDDFGEDVRHETAHAVLHTLLPMVPLWLDEGLAEYFEVPAARRFDGHAHLTQIRGNLRWHRPAPLAKLEAIGDLRQMQQAQYRDAWSWVHYLLHGPQAAQQEFRQYLSDVHQHTPPGQLSRRLQRQIPDLSRSYADHFARITERAA